jgi:hypothetical protein
MTDLHTELADLALSLANDARALHAASASFAPLAKKADAVEIAAGMAAKQRRWRELMRQVIRQQADQKKVEAARNARLDAERLRLLPAEDFMAA